MCGRFILGVVREDLERLVDEHYGILNVGDVGILPRYNVAPGQDVVAVVGAPAGNRIGPLRWGYAPAWVARPSASDLLVNIRAEGLSTRPQFADAFARRRCLILADGFYEWRKDPDGRTPFRFFLPDAPLFAMAGLWGMRILPDGKKQNTCAIVTTAANDLMRPIHDRMPVILAAADRDAWLAGDGVDAASLARLLVPFDAGRMAAHPVSRRVNDARADGPGLILPV